MSMLYMLYCRNCS